MSSKNVLILGATGLVGVYTAVTLKAKGYSVYAAAHRSNDNGFFADFGIPYYSFDISDSKSFEILPKDVDVILDFAGAMPARMQGYNPYAYTDSIITGTLNVLEYMRAIGCKRIIFTHSIADIVDRFGSTEALSADLDMHFPLTGDHSVYSISKNTAVSLLKHYQAQWGFETFILRLPTIYAYQPNPYIYINGERKWFGFRFLIEEAIKGNTLQIWGDPKSEKEMVYVLDFVQLTECCVRTHRNGGIYNVGSGFPISIEEQIHLIADTFNTTKKSEIIYCPEKPSSPQFVLDIENARQEIGYAPKYDFKLFLNEFKKDLENEPFAKLWGKRSDFN